MNECAAIATADTVAIAAVAALLVGGVLLGLAGRAIERREWNGGICRESGRPWSRFGRCWGGDRGYTDGAGHYCWISWPGVDSARRDGYASVLRRAIRALLAVVADPTPKPGEAQ